jgi:predicted O-linked N-acetylglucosamine transferase (SPINDLY family)
MITVQQAFAQAFAHEAAGRFDAAQAIYRQILVAIPEHPGALSRIAFHQRRAADLGAARATLARAFVSARAQALPLEELWLAQAELEAAEGNPGAARAACGEALSARPDFAAARLLLGRWELEAGNAAEAELHLRAVTATIPTDTGALTHLALALAAQRRFDEAEASIAQALALAPDAPEIWYGASVVAFKGGANGLAEARIREALQRAPGRAPSLHLLGMIQKAAGSFAAARATLLAATIAAPEDAGTWVTLGGVCLDLGLAVEARKHLEHAVHRGAQGAAVWDNLGLAHRRSGDLSGAVAAFARAVAADPKFVPSLSNLVQARKYLCDWDGLDALEQQLVALADDPASDPRLSPAVALSLPLSPAARLAAARRWSRAMLPTPVAPRPPHARGDRLRVGYLSSDFRDHPTGRLMVGLFERHDRRRVEVFGYSYGPREQTPLRSRIEKAVDRWREVSDRSDAEIARMISADGIDVLVDRKGHTHGGRLGILAHRPAPVQLHYMSFPGTLGFDAIDGVIADAEVAPPAHDAHFHERVWRLPRCYFVNDDQRGLPAAPLRARVGLPEQGLVLASLNQSYKLTRPVFALWLGALRAAPSAVLWLFADDPRTQARLRTEAVRAGVAAERLIFAATVPQDEHIARIRCADLALDTLPYGSHTTGTDALWGGVPLLSCRGGTFAGRVGASLLVAAGLPELVTESLDAYRERLLELVAAPAQLAAWREHLEQGRKSLPLWDTVGFARDLEALLEDAYIGTIAARQHSP